MTAKLTLKESALVENDKLADLIVQDRRTIT